MSRRKGELYTPITWELINHIERMVEKYSTVQMVQRETGVQWRVLKRTLHAFDSPRSARRTVSFSIMDKLVSATDVGSVDDYPWYTPSQLIERGIWKPSPGRRTTPRK